MNMPDLELLNKFSKVTKEATFTGPNAIKDAHEAANKLADSANTNIFANVLVNGKRMTVPGTQTTKASNQNSNIVIKEDRAGKIGDPKKAAELLATAEAAKRGITTSVTVNGVKFTAQPPARPTDIKNSAKGKPGTVAGTNIEEPNGRTGAISALEQGKNLSSMDENDGGSSSPSIGGSSFEKAIQYGTPRGFGGAVSSLEGVLEGVSAGALKGVLKNLPPVFKSMLPMGALPGIMQSSPIPLNSIMKIATGAALGSVTGQAIRSLSGGITASSGLTAALGATAISQVTVSALGPKARGYSPATAVLSNVIGSTVSKTLINNNFRIPVSRRVIGTVANVSLNSYNRNVGIPTNLMGTTASNAAYTSIARVIGGSISGRIPILPTNLSLGAILGGSSGIGAAIAAGAGLGALGAMGGIAQNLGQGDVANLFSPGALANAMPPNISGLLNSAIPPRTSNPFGEGPNDITARRNFAPAERSNLPTGNQRPPVESPKGEVLKGGNVDYNLIISPGGRTLGELVFPGGRKGYRIPQDGQLGYSLEKIVDGLRYIATNVVDPLDRMFGKGIITNGFRGPGGSNYPGSDHCTGAAVDMSWRSAAKHYEIAQYIAKYIKTEQVLLEYKYAGDTGHLHIAAGPNVRNKNKSLKVGSSFDDGRTLKPGLQRPSWV